MKNIDELKTKIKQHEDELKKLKETLDTLTTEDPACTLARELHNKFCMWNHTDGCSWHYEIKNGIDQWNELAHEQWIRKANGILRYCEHDNITLERFFDYINLIRG